MVTYAVVDDTLSPDLPLGVELEASCAARTRSARGHGAAAQVVTLDINGLLWDSRGR
jgi:hypothetical protein